MNAQTSSAARLIRRESATRQTIAGIRAKIDRLQNALNLRSKSLTKIQREIAAATTAVPIAVEHEQPSK